MEEIDLEKSLLSYLNIYGNTRESDLVEFGVSFSGRPKEELAKIIDDMVANGSIRRITHHLIESNAVYIARSDLSLGLSIESSTLDLKNKEKLAEEAKLIEREAKTVAEKRIKKSKPIKSKKQRTEKKRV